MCAVYIVIAGDYAAAKIGKANDPKRRVSDLQVGNHEVLRLLRVFEGDEAEEAALHLRFAHMHRRGDWFSFSREMLGDVGLVEILEPEAAEDLSPITASPDENFHAWAIEACGNTEAVRRALNADQSTVSCWKRRGVPGRFWVELARLAASRDIEGVTVERLAETSKPRQPRAKGTRTEAATFAIPALA